MKECPNIEWKKTWSDGYLKWICRFANAQGSKPYIGVNDSENIVGVKNAPKLLEDIPNKIVTTLGIGTKAKAEGGVRITIFRKNGVPNGEQIHQSSPKSSPNSSPMSPKDIIIAMIQENPKMTITKMAERLGIGVRAVKKHIAALEDAKVINRFGAPRTGHWVIIAPVEEEK